MRARTGMLAAAMLVACGLAAAWLLPQELDPARVRGALERAATERLRATVTIEGPVRFALLPRPVLVAGRVSLLHGVPGDPDALAVTADTLTARLDLSALWRGRLSAAELVLDGAEVQAPFPFDVRVLTAGRPASLATTAILIRQGRVRLGPIVADQVEARLDADRLTGDVTLAGSFRLPDRSAWRGSLRLSRAGGDGSATLDARLDEIYAADGLSAALAGQLAGDGGLSGRISVSGPNLARLLPAPPVPFSAIGRASLAGGVAAIDDVALTLDGVAARLDGSLRLPPQSRLDLRLAASRLDLDAWRAAFAASPDPPAALPVGLELSAEAAGLAGGALRQLRAGVELDGDHVVVRHAEALLPGGMTVRTEGTIDLAAQTSRLDVSADGADLRTTLAWLAGAAGLVVPAALPDRFRTLTGQAHVETSGRELEAHDIAAALDGVPLRGDAVLSWPRAGSGGRANAGAILALDRLDLSPVLAWARGGAAWPFPAVDASLRLTTPHAVWPGGEAASLDADLAVRTGALQVDRLRAATADWQLDASGARSAEGRWSDVALALTASRLANLAALLPDRWRDRLASVPALAALRLRASVRGSGTADAPSGSVEADLGDLHVDASARADAAGHLRGAAAVRHPSARSLAALAGIPVAFVGEGSLSATADAAFDGAAWTSEDATLHAGGLEVAGDHLRLDVSGAAPRLTGRLRAPVLMLPRFDWRSRVPLPLSLLLGWGADLDVTAGRVEGLGFGLSDLGGRLTLTAATLGLSDLSVRLQGGGAVAGHMALDTASLPPRATAALSFEGVRLGAKAWQPLDLLAGEMSGTADLAAQGFAPAALLATMSGAARATSNSASLVGIDVGGLGGNLSDAAVRGALAGGRTLLDRVTVSAAFAHGLATVRGEAAASGGAAIAADGTVFLPEATVDLGLSVRPAITDPPRIDMRLSGPADHAALIPALGDLARWRAARP